MAKLKIGDVAWTLDDGGIGIVCAVSDDGAFYRLNMHDGGQIDCGHLLVAPRPDLLPYGKPDAKWVEMEYNAPKPDEHWHSNFGLGAPFLITTRRNKTRAAAIRALRNLAIEYGMNIKIMEDER